jgi:hypothetical protein
MLATICSGAWKTYQRKQGARRAMSQQAGRLCMCMSRQPARWYADNHLPPDSGELCSPDGTSPRKTCPEVSPRGTG